MSSNQSESVSVISDELNRTKTEPSSPTMPDTMLKYRKNPDNPADGSVILGKGTDTSYVTRYRIIKEKQREMIREDMMEDFVPFCYPKERRSCLRTVWQFVKSEPFLLTLHIAALIFSVLKRTMRDVEIDATLELVHSCIETFVAVMSLVIRMAAGREKFHEEKVVRKEIEFCADSVRTLTLKRAMCIFYTIGTSLIVFLVATLSVFIAFDKLHWTIVTTNFALIVGGIGGNLTLQRLEGMINRIREDQHKAIIYESLLLLRDCATETKRVELGRKVNKFCDCVENTELFKRKEHIDYDGENQFIASNWNVPAMLTLQTSV